LPPIAVLVLHEWGAGSVTVKYRRDWLQVHRSGALPTWGQTWDMQSRVCF